MGRIEGYLRSARARRLPESKDAPPSLVSAFVSQYELIELNWPRWASVGENGVDVNGYSVYQNYVAD